MVQIIPKLRAPIVRFGALSERFRSAFGAVRLYPFPVNYGEPVGAMVRYELSFPYQWEIFRIQQMKVRKRTICLAIFCGDVPEMAVDHMGIFICYHLPFAANSWTLRITQFFRLESIVFQPPSLVFWWTSFLVWENRSVFFFQNGKSLVDSSG